MCGIIAYIGKKEAFEILREGLKRIEYRGYDSAGIAILEGKINLSKGTGRIEEALKERLKGKIGIGHTRWATHGKVNKVNSHPQIDCKGKIAIVHNGVIENVEELKGEIGNHNIISETDTEVIAHLIEEKIKSGKLPMEAIREVLIKLKGSFAFALLIEGEDKIFFARKDSPLLIGIGKDEMFLGSDSAAFSKYVDYAIALEDYDYGYISKDREAIFNALTGKKASRKAFKIEDREDVNKGKYEYFMIKEIEEQRHRVYDMLSSDTSKAEALLEEYNRVHIIGAGTSYHAARMLKYLLEREKGKESDVMISSEYLFFKKPGKDTLVVAFSQSGETADTLKAVKFAKSRGAKIIGITNIRGSSLDRLSDERVYLNAGLEVGVAATKTFLAQLIVSYKLTMELEGKEIKELIEHSLKAENVEIVKRYSALLARKEHVFYLGRGLNFPIAMEGSLKLKEITYIHSEAYPSGELKHGPISLIDRNSIAIFLAPNDETFRKTLSNIEEVKARGARVITLSDVSIGDDLISIAKPSKKELYPFSELVPLQLLAYYTAREKGLDTDKPRNLAKSVTVE